MGARATTFRFTYFTDKYLETFDFYTHLLAFDLVHSWDRSDDDKGALFKIGNGTIEILQRPKDPTNRYPGLDYRIPQGVFTGIQVNKIEELFQEYTSRNVPFKLDMIDQPWGHRSFYVKEPNGLVLGFYQEQF